MDDTAEKRFTAADVALEVKERFASAVRKGSGPDGDVCVWVDGPSLPDVLRFLKEERRFDVLMDETCVDFPDRPKRFEVIYNLYSLSTGNRIFLKVEAGDVEPGVPSATGLYGSADWFEREIHDMFGVRFANHPDLRRLLMYEGFEGHPLRKDYPATKRQPIIGPADGPDHEARHG
jgi:NADH-quinone oxidoreductase subunit C